jgi:hypothetical protein
MPEISASGIQNLNGSSSNEKEPAYISYPGFICFIGKQSIHLILQGKHGDEAGCFSRHRYRGIQLQEQLCNGCQPDRILPASFDNR